MLDNIIVVRSGGDIGTAVAHKLHRSGFSVLITEIPEPLAIRRMVAFSEAVFDGEVTVEGVRCRKISTIEEAESCFKEKVIPLIIDESGSVIDVIKPSVVIDAILAKRNINTRMSMAPMTIGLGPGFTVGVDVHAVIETNRGHDLGRIIYKGGAERNTGIPGVIMGYGGERVLRASATGKVMVVKGIGELVEKDEVVMMIGDAEVKTQIAGVVRGCIRDGVHVPKDMKIGDVDPRGVLSNCETISDKARCIAGGVLEAVMNHLNFNKGDNGVGSNI